MVTRWPLDLHHLHDLDLHSHADLGKGHHHTVFLCRCDGKQLQVGGSTHHWMISVIWASQWATLSFLSANSLISSSSCL